MAVRTVGVKLTAEVSQYMAGMRLAGAAARTLRNELNGTAKAGDLDEIARQAAGLGVGLSAVGDAADKVREKTRRTTKETADGLDDLTKLTNRLDRELKALDVPELDLTADPAQVLRAIGVAERRLGELRDDADSVELRVRTTRALGDLATFRRSLGDVGPKLGATLGISTSQGFFASLSGTFKNPPAAVFAGAGVLAAALTPTLAAGVAGAVVGGAAAGGIIGGVTLAARDQRVKSAGAELGAFILGDLSSRASGFVPVVLDGIDDIRAGWKTLGPDLDRIFASSRFVDPLVAGAISGGRKLVAGLADAVEEAGPVIDAFGRSFDAIGDAVGDVFSTLAQDADEGASAIDDLTGAVTTFIRVSGGLIHVAAEVKGYSDELDVAIDKGRYWLEDMEHYKGWLDITADGFKVGSKEAEAWRKATLGTAEASDFATLKLAGKTDAEIAAADASGTYRQKTDEVNAALGRSAAFYFDATSAADKLKERTALLGEVQGVAAQEMDALLTRTGAVTGAMDAQRGMADLLRQAHEKMYGSVITASEANEGYEASWDDLSASVEKNGGSLKINTAEGRNNRDALQELLGRTNDLFFAEIETGSSVEEATKKHNDRIKAVKEEARRLNLNKEETEKLIEVYGRIPPDKSTNLMVEGLQQIGKALTDLYVFQRSLATGRTLAQVRSDLFGGYAGDPRVFKAEGGPIPGWSPSDTADNIPVMATADEYMIRRWSARKLGRSTLDYINAHGELPAVQGYAKGGSIEQLTGRDWGRRMPFPVDVHGTHVMTREQAAAKVVEAAPSGGATAPWMTALIRRVFPHLGLISGFRPGSRTLSGGQSYHALNRAVDFPPDRALAGYMYRNYKPRLREAITPFPEFNVLNGRDHTYTGAVWRQHAFGYGNAHDHFAMNHGGRIGEPVLGYGLRSGASYSFAERGPEWVTPDRPAVPAASAGPQHSPVQLASAIRAALTGVTVQMDGRTVGAIQGRQADLLAR